MRILYHAAVVLVSALLPFLSFFSPRIRAFYRGRQGYFDDLAKSLNDNKRPLAWFHCASLGEFEQGRPLLERFKVHFPHYAVLLTFFSPSGFEVRKNYAQADWVKYLPLDTPGAARRFIAIVQPKVCFFNQIRVLAPSPPAGTPLGCFDLFRGQYFSAPSGLFPSLGCVVEKEFRADSSFFCSKRGFGCFAACAWLGSGEHRGRHAV